MLPYQEVARQPLAQGLDLTGQPFKVFRVKHNTQLNNVVGDTTVTVQLSDRSYGFTDESEAFRFLTTPGELEFDEHDAFGNVTKVKREGLGLPDGMIRKFEQNAVRQQVQTPVASGPVTPQGVPVAATPDHTHTVVGSQDMRFARPADEPTDQNPEPKPSTPSDVTTQPVFESVTGPSGPTGSTGSTGSKRG